MAKKTKENCLFIVIINIHFACTMKTNWMLVTVAFICSVPLDRYTRYFCKTVGKYGDIVNHCSYITQLKQLWNLSLKKNSTFFKNGF